MSLGYVVLLLIYFSFYKRIDKMYYRKNIYFNELLNMNFQIIIKKYSEIMCIFKKMF